MTGSVKSKYRVINTTGFRLTHNGPDRHKMRYYIRHEVADNLLEGGTTSMEKHMLSDFVVDLTTNELIKCRPCVTDVLEAYIERQLSEEFVDPLRGIEG